MYTDDIDWKEESAAIRQAIGNRLDFVSLEHPYLGSISVYDWRPEVLVQGVLNALGDYEGISLLAEAEGGDHGLLFAPQSKVVDRFYSLNSADRIDAYASLDPKVKFLQAYLDSQSRMTGWGAKNQMNAEQIPVLSRDAEALILLYNHATRTNNSYPSYKGHLVNRELLHEIGANASSVADTLKLDLNHKASLEGRAVSELNRWQKKIAEMRLGVRLPESVDEIKI